MDLNEMIQKLVAAELAKIEQPATEEPKVEAKAFDAEALVASLSEKLGDVVSAAVDAKVESLKAAAQPKGIVAKGSDLESDPIAYLAAKSARGEAFTDEEKRIAWAVTDAALREGLR